MVSRFSIPRRYCWVAYVGVLAGSACNSILNIEEAELICDSEPCDTGVSEPVVDGSRVAMPSPGSSEVGLGSAAAAPVSADEQGTLASPGVSLGADGGVPVEVSVGSPGLGGGVAGEVPGGATDVVSPDPAAGPERGPDGLAVALPDDLIGAPVAGEIVSYDAAWEVNGVFEPTFEIHTPTASYWIAKPLGTMVSMQDGFGGAQWIDFSSGFRPLRGVPSFAEPPRTQVSTLRDEASLTPTHVRLISQSADGAWHWVWDFYITHVTFTVNRAPVALSLSYRGVPGGSLGTEDRLVLSGGVAQGARNSFAGELAGPVEWAYIADGALRRSVFFMQHTDDALFERYQVRDNDSSHWTFGEGQITSLPIRFSLGLIDSVDHAALSQRVQFIAGAIR